VQDAFQGTSLLVLCIPLVPDADDALGLVKISPSTCLYKLSDKTVSLCSKVSDGRPSCDSDTKRSASHAKGIAAPLTLSELEMFPGGASITSQGQRSSISIATSNDSGALVGLRANDGKIRSIKSQICGTRAGNAYEISWCKRISHSLTQNYMVLAS
jgi:hypothetical protein